MKIPQVFLLDKPSEEKLEGLLKVKMVKKVSDYKYDCYCSICGGIAGSIEAVFEGISKPDRSIMDYWPSTEWLDFQGKRVRYEQPKLLIKNFYGMIEVEKGERFLEEIIINLNRKDLKSVYKKLDGNYLTFYNLDEDKCYCWDHWKGHLEEKIPIFR